MTPQSRFLRGDVMRWSLFFEPGGGASGLPIHVDDETPYVTREQLLRYRWEDQLKAINPDLWDLVEAELTPTFQEVVSLRDQRRDLRQELWQATQEDSARRTTRSQLRKDVTRLQSNQDTLREQLRQRTEEATNTAADALTLAQALQRLTLMLTALDDFPPESPLSDEEITILRSYVPPDPPTNQQPKETP